MSRLLILHSCASIDKMPAILNKNGVKTCLLLVSDYEKVREIDQRLHEVVRVKDISAMMQETADYLRRPFYKLTAKMGSRYNSLEWWASDISARNTMTSNLFLHCCYVFIASEEIDKEKNLCIVADNASVIKNIEFLARKKHINVVRDKHLEFGQYLPCEFFAGLFKLALHIVVRAIARLNRFYHRVITRRLKTEQNPDVILHTWVDEKCFGPDGQFRDRYFTVLPEHYRAKGVSWSTFITFSYRNITRSLWSAFSFLHTNRDHFIIPEDYYNTGDYLFPFKLWFNQRRFKFEGTILEKVDLSVLFKEYNRREPVHFESMFYLLFKRLAENNIKPEVIIDGFENMSTDKLIQLGVRKFMPGTPVYGFYHTAPSPNVLCFFTDTDERDIAPIPDRIISNGARFRDILIREQYPAERIVEGSALRFHYLYGLKKAPVKKSDEFRILVVLSIEKDAVIELFQKVKEAISDISRYKMILKPHPMQTKILDVIKDEFLPDTEVFTGGMDVALNKCDIVVSAATGAVLDCIMADREVIRVGRSTQIDFDPLAWFDEFGKPSYSVEDLREKLLDAELRMKSPDYREPCYSTMLPELFSPVTEELLKPFLPPSYSK